jgi:hypothetical protein
MKNLERSVNLLAEEFLKDNVEITYLEINEFAVDAIIYIKTSFHSESFNVMHHNDKYFLDTTSVGFSNSECNNVEEVISTLRDRVIYGMKINGPKVKPIDMKKVKSLSKKHNINIVEFIGSTFIESSGFKILADIEKEFAYLTVGLKTIEIPFDKVNSTLESLSSFEAIN